MDVAVVYSLPTRRGRSSEFVVTDTDTETSAKKIYDALTSRGRVSVKLFPVTENAIDDIKRIRADIIINLVEWDGLDMPLTLRAFDAIAATGIPCAGATKTNYWMTTDKIRMKKALKAHRLPTAGWQVFYTGRERPEKQLRYPLIVKLAQTHCSVGLNENAVVNDDQALLTQVKKRITSFAQPVIAEEFIEGREFQVTLLERKDGVAVLPAAEILFDKGGSRRFLTFRSRWSVGHPDYQSSHIGEAVLDADLFKKIQLVSVRAFKELKFRDYARFDVRVQTKDGHDEVLFLETNGNPGLDDDDEYGLTISFKAAGLSFADFLMEIIQSTLRHAKVNHRA